MQQKQNLIKTANWIFLMKSNHDKQHWLAAGSTERKPSIWAASFMEMWDTLQSSGTQWLRGKIQTWKFTMFSLWLVCLLALAWMSTRAQTSACKCVCTFKRVSPKLLLKHSCANLLLSLSTRQTLFVCCSEHTWHFLWVVSGGGWERRCLVIWREPFKRAFWLLNHSDVVRDSNHGSKNRKVIHHARLPYVLIPPVCD